MASDRGDTPTGGRGMPRHAQLRRRRRRASWPAAGVAVAVIIGGAGVLVLHPRAPAGARQAHSGHHRNPAVGHSGGTPLSAARIGSSASGTPAPAVATVSITDVGDMNFGMDGHYPPGGGPAVFASVADELHSNLTVGNLQTALGSGGVTKCPPHSTYCYAFQAPADFAVAVQHAGFSAVNVANNHTDDAGPIGIQETDTALTTAHLRWTGRPAQTTYLVRRGVKIALLGFAPYDYDRNLLDIPAAVAAVRQAAAHAQLVIVFIHAGAEGREPSTRGREWRPTSARSAATPWPFPTPSSAPAPISCSAPGRTSCGPCSGITAGSSPTASATSRATTPLAWAGSRPTAPSCTCGCARTARSPQAP